MEISLMVGAWRKRNPNPPVTATHGSSTRTRRARTQTTGSSASASSSDANHQRKADPSMLWLVEIHDDDFEYDCFVSGVVWAENANEATALIRRDVSSHLPQGDKTRLIVSAAPTSGIVHEHWHAG